MSLDLYARIEPFLDFQEEVYKLHNVFLEHIVTKDRIKVLDVGCGQGDFLINLNLNNIDNMGIDLSKEQIAVCLQKDLNAQVIDLCELQDNFDCITAIFDVINYIPKADLKSFFDCAYARLEKGGYFLFDVNTFFGFDEIAQGTLSIDNETEFISIDAVFDENLLETTMTLFSKQNDLYNKEQSSIKQYYHDNATLTKILKLSGFEVVDIEDFYLHNDEEPDKQIYICRK